MSYPERNIPITGAGVQPFWTAYTTAPASTLSPLLVSGTVAQTGAGSNDGYVDILSDESYATPSTFVDFDTAMRVTLSSVPFVSKQHEQSWFSCFSVRFNAWMQTRGSRVRLDIVSTTNSRNNMYLTLRPVGSTLVFDGAEVDVTSVVADIASLADRHNSLVLDVVEFHVIARRLPGHSIGDRAVFELRFGLFKAGTCTEVYRVQRTMKTTELFRSAFTAGLGLAELPSTTPAHTQALLRLFDFELGANPLNSNASGMTV